MPIKIYLDAGHNPENPNAGAEGNGLREQDITFDVAMRTALLFESDPDYETRLSRPNPEIILGTSNVTSLAARTNDANTWGADYFISIHTNASTFRTATGSECYVYSINSPSFGLAGQILSALHEFTGLPTRGIFTRPSLFVLRKTKMPAVLVELGFITNTNDAALMSEHPDLFAGALYSGITRYT